MNHQNMNKQRRRDNLSEMLEVVKKIRKERDWDKYHTPKNMAMDLVRESSEVLEHFIWATNQEIKNDGKRIEKIQAEMADVLHTLLVLADILNIDLSQSFWGKLEEIKDRYPASEIKGKSGYDYKNQTR
jgi:NTP pyrophosphatase (non-canonical NTP hydrolase)